MAQDNLIIWPHLSYTGPLVYSDFWVRGALGQGYDTQSMYIYYVTYRLCMTVFSWSSSVSCDCHVTVISCRVTVRMTAVWGVWTSTSRCRSASRSDFRSTTGSCSKQSHLSLQSDRLVVWWSIRCCKDHTYMYCLHLLCCKTKNCILCIYCESLFRLERKMVASFTSFMVQFILIYQCIIL